MSLVVCQIRRDARLLSRCRSDAGSNWVKFGTLAYRRDSIGQSESGRLTRNEYAANQESYCEDSNVGHTQLS